MAGDLKPIEVLQLYPPHGGTLSGLLRSRAAVAGAREFLRLEERFLSWTGFEREVRKVASALHASGIARGDRIAVMSPSCMETVALLFAASRLGAISFR